MDIREKLVELLNGIIDGGFKWHSYSYESGEQLNNDEIAQHLISHGVTVQEWIPASEPPKSITNKVLVHCKNGYIGFGHYEEFRGVKDWYNLENGKPFREWDLEDCETYEVTHWMPLPEPPKGE